MIPIPTHGEIFIRYGPAPAATPDQPGAPAIMLPAGADDPAQTAAASADTAGAARADGAAASALSLDAAAISEIVRAELARAGPASAALQPDSVTTITRADLAELEERLATRLTVPSDTALAAASLDAAAVTEIVRAELLRAGTAGAALTQPDTLGRVTRADLVELEERLASRLATMLSEASSTATPDPAAPAQPSAEMAELSRQVDELAQLVRDGMVRDPASPALVSVTGAPLTEVVTEMQAPFVPALELRLGSSSVRNAGPGVGVAMDASLGNPWVGRLQPYAGVHFAQASVDGAVGSTPFAGSVTSVGAAAGMQLALPQIRSLAPALSVGVSGIAGGTRGDTPAEATVIDDLYGGFVMGPRVALTTEWDRLAGSSLRVMGSVARLWAGPRGGWSVQAGVRWSRPEQPTTVVRPVIQPLALQSTDSRPPAPAAPAATAGDTVVVSTTDPAVTSRLEALEASLRQEREARARAERSADSIAAQNLAVRARADTLAATAAEVERVRREAEARSEELRRTLQALVGVAPDVQSVRETGRGLEVVIGGGLFPAGSTTLAPAARAQVERVGQLILQGPSQRLLVVGHTDATGSAETNRVISQRRAEAVRDALVDAGLDEGAINVIASGEDAPIADNETADGRSRNRRVEVVVLGLGPS
jgi:outer membrane protein OmpA-like peptidoglycan-associated protein